MRMRGMGGVSRVAAGAVLFVIGLAAAQAQAPQAALSGRVTSLEEGAMEGVVVGAKRAGSTMTVSVISDKDGRYSFPANRLEPGQYALRIRATGYVLDSGSAVTIGPQKAATADIKLRKASVDEVASQLSNSEWLMSWPGTRQQKDSIRGCNHCHTFERIMRTKYDPDTVQATIERMSRHTPNSFPNLIQPNAPARVGAVDTPESRQRLQETRKKMAEFISSINLSKGANWAYPLKQLPRPSGKATKVIYTEYDLPSRTRQPHDVIVDSQGYAWYASFGEQILGRLNPKTGEVKEWPIPVLKPTRNKGVLDVEFDADENVWFGNGFQGAIQMFDRKKETFRSYPLPPELDSDHAEVLFIAPQNHKVDNKVWVMNNGELGAVLRVDIVTGKWERFFAFPAPRPRNYTVLSDSQNNAWFTVIERSHIARIDAKTGDIKLFETDQKDSGPRRGMVDAQDRVWAALNRTDEITMFDQKTQKFQSWATGIPEYYAYDVWVDRNGDAWASTEYADRVVRVNPKSGEATAYLLPGPTNMRRSYGDNATTLPSFWVGATHTSSIVRLEPLE